MPLLSLLLTILSVVGLADRPSVAVVIAGQQRTALAWPVVASFRRHVVGALEASGHEVAVFAALVVGGVDETAHADAAAPAEAAEAVARAVAAAYPRVAAARAFAAGAPDDPSAWAPPRPAACALERAESNGRVLRQFGALRAGLRLVEAHEAAARGGRRFDHVLRTRTDLVYFADAPAPPPPSVALVPAGGMTRLREYECLNDHLLFCPRALCRPYFELLELWESPHCRFRVAAPDAAGGAAPTTAEPDADGALARAAVGVPAGRDAPPDAPYALPALPRNARGRPITAQWFVLARYGGALGDCNREPPTIDAASSAAARRLDAKNATDPARCGAPPPQAPRRARRRDRAAAAAAGGANCTCANECGALREVAWPYAIMRAGDAGARAIECQYRMVAQWRGETRASDAALAACKATAAAWERDNSGDPSSASDPGHPP